MQEITARRVLIAVIGVFSLSLMLGCSGLEKRPANRSGYLYYHAELVYADRALDEARAAGKDKECPAEFNALQDMVDKAYEVYMACRTQEAIDMAQEAIGKIKALCPPPPRCELTASPNSIEKCDSSTLTLTTSGNVKSAFLDGTEMSPSGGTMVVTPASTTSYSAKVSDSGRSNTCNVTVTVTSPPPPVCPTPPPPAVKRVVDRLTIHVNFDFDKSEIRKADVSELKKAIDFVRKYPGAEVKLEGHTDSRGTEEYNRNLSERRAEAVRQYLIKEGSIDKTMISATGYGELRPIAPNETPNGKDNPEGRAENRRVEVLIISE